MEEKSALVPVKDILLSIWSSTEIEIIDDLSIKQISEPVGYIEPELKEIKKSHSPFIIISAPGAVGKTTFAKYSARAKNGYYWDLSKIKLASNTFSGTLLETFGASKMSDVLSDISTGSINLFIDSFDEAEIISGLDGIEKFLKDVYHYAKNSPRPNIVLFSRSETAGYIQLIFDTLSGTESYSLYEIDYFNEEAAAKFIEYRITQRSDIEQNQRAKNNHQKHKTPFEKAVKNIFSAIAIGINQNSESFWDDDEIRSFLGYSPVLETIGDFLYDMNYEEISQTFEQKQTVEGGLEIISDFINKILKRDQDKFLTGLRERVVSAPNNFDWNSIYTPDDQIKFVLNLASRNPSLWHNVDLKPVPNWLEKDFKESITTFISNHPFIRNGKFSSPALRDYVLAKLINDDKFSEPCLRSLNSGQYVLTSLFVHFYSKFYDKECYGNHLSYIYESSTSKASMSDNLLTFVKKTNNHYEVEIINANRINSSNLRMKCVVDDHIPLEFTRRILNAQIDIDHDVVIGRESSSFEISNTEINSRKILVKASELIVTTHFDQNSILIAKEIENSNYNLNIKILGNGKLLVNGDGTNKYPWATYRKEIESNSIEGVRPHLYNLKRIMEPFRKHGKNEFAKQYEFIDNEIIKDSIERRLLLKYMIEIGIIDKNTSDKKYYMNEQKSIEHGINWMGLKNLDYNDALITFLKEFQKKYSTELDNSQ
ncbi:MAG: hypothetical protein HYZ14_15710 [Bacteroidetes bacterium]|nr:hypothetical protein [Bacteroidota bacterium]